MGLTANGYERPIYDEILTTLTNKARELFGENIAVNEQTPLGKFIRIIAYDRAKVEEEMELIFYSRFPNTASGVNLDRLCVYVGISRNPATPSVYELTVKGKAGYIVPYGFEVSTDSEIVFRNTKETVIGADGTCKIIVQCAVDGSIGNVNGATITQIVNPVADIESVGNGTVLTIAVDTESDYELRQRFVQAGAGLGSCNEVALKSALIRVPTVTSSKVIVNDTDETDEGGRPPHSFTCYVTGGVGYEKEIAETIFDKKPVGIRTHGTTTYVVTDESGLQHNIQFSRTTNVNVYVRLSLITTSAFEGAKGIEQIQNNVKSYVNSLGVGNSVILSAIYSYIYSVAGVKEVTSLELSTDGSIYSAGNITVSDVENAVCTSVEVNT